MKTNGPVRRSQLISPFGVGSTFVLPDGVSVITCGLDHWFDRETGTLDEREVDTSEFVLREWRLERRLGVSEFRLPPDFRRQRRGGDGTNEDLTVPVLRFPQWHVCPFCGQMKKVPLNRVEDVECDACRAAGRRIPGAQVRFVCVCEAGHLQDFPWLEWVHASAHPLCTGPLKLSSTGSLSVAGQRVECLAPGCRAKRSLSGAVYSNRDSGRSNLSDQLQKGAEFLCPGNRPWLGEHNHEACDEPLHVALRAASNVYFAQVRSAIYVPRDRIPEELLRVLTGVTARTVIGTIVDLGVTPSVAQLRKQLQEKLGRFTDEEVQLGIDAVLPDHNAGSSTQEPGPSSDDEIGFRREELAALEVERRLDELFVRRADTELLGSDLGGIVSGLMLVERLKETRALVGFSRFSTEPRPLPELKQQMWANPPEWGRGWLPAYEVFGEGILMSLDEPTLREWEARTDVREWVGLLDQRNQKAQKARGRTTQPVSPRFLLVHTLAHLLIDRLTYRCGYSSASLRERLYVSEDPDSPMAALLIYTAAGDSDGTLGGLVRLGEPEFLSVLLREAIEKARWCSADPVCSEIGRAVGQGPDSCNLAACHNCVLLPETACENSNRFLDRLVVVGTVEKPELGFFSQVAYSSAVSNEIGESLSLAHTPGQGPHEDLELPD
jgi:hypothetical protein